MTKSWRTPFTGDLSTRFGTQPGATAPKRRTTAPALPLEETVELQGQGMQARAAGRGIEACAHGVYTLLERARRTAWLQGWNMEDRKQRDKARRAK